jgi:hypothetical protein
MGPIKNASKKLFEKIVESNRKTFLLNWKSLKKEWTALSVFFDSEKLLPGGSLEN